MAVFLDRDTARMPITTRRAAFWKGCRESTPFFLVSCLFGLLFGVLAAEAGLGIIESTAFTVLLFAGSVQFTALQLMQQQAPRADRFSFSTGCKLARDIACNLTFSAAADPAPVQPKTRPRWATKHH